MTAPQPTAHVLCGSIPIRSIPAPLPRSNLALELVSAASEAPARPRSHAPYRTTRASAARTPQVAAALAARVARRRPSPVRRPLGFAWSRAHRRLLQSGVRSASPGARGKRGKRHRLLSITGTSLPTPFHLEHVVSGGSGAVFPPSPAPPFRRLSRRSSLQRRPVAEAARPPVGRARLAFSSVPPCRVAAQRCKKQFLCYAGISLFSKMQSAVHF